MKTIIKNIETGERVDKFLAQKFPEFSRNYFSNLIEGKNVLVNGKIIKASYALKESDEITIKFIEDKKIGDIKPEKIKLNIIFEDKDVIVINKQPALVVHPAAGNLSGTLINALTNHFPAIKNAIYDKNSEISKLRPGLVHRLDKDTSGVMVVAKNEKAMHSLSRQIQSASASASLDGNRTVKKTYLAICYGWPKNISGHLKNYLGRHPKNRKKIADIGEEKGKEALSDYKVIKYLKDNAGNKISLIEFLLQTGRTHQIRVQSKYMGHPVMGDQFYGSKESMKLSSKLGIKRQLLHARSLEITLPEKNKTSKFLADVPLDFLSLLDKFTSA